MAARFRYSRDDARYSHPCASCLLVWAQTITMQHIEKLTAKAGELLAAVKEYESDTFSASARHLTDDEAEAITAALIGHAIQQLIDTDTLDGVRLTEELENVRSEAKKGKRFIITDPCYIMAQGQYDEICDAGADFEGQTFPLASTHRDTGEKITFHTIEGTPNGDGSYTYKGQSIGVDAGMLCIAEGDDWEGEDFGATFDTLEQARAAFPQIIKRF